MATDLFQAPLLLGLDAAAEYAGVVKQTISRWAAEGKIGKYPMSGFDYESTQRGGGSAKRWAFSPDEIDRMTKLPSPEYEGGEPGRTCRACGVFKPVSELRKNKACRLGVTKICNRCVSEQVMRRRDEAPDVALNSHLRRTFGITLDQYNALLERQNGVCAICGEPPTIIMGRRSPRQGRMVRPRLVVDHCHETGLIRGLLCTPCNRGIGILGDNAERVKRALFYLEGGETLSVTKSKSV